MPRTCARLLCTSSGLMLGEESGLCHSSGALERVKKPNCMALQGRQAGHEGRPGPDPLLRLRRPGTGLARCGALCLKQAPHPGLEHVPIHILSMPALHAERNCTVDARLTNRAPQRD